MTKNLAHKIFSAIAALSLVINSLATPLYAYAQDATPTETPTPTATATPDATVSPSESPTATPTDIASPSSSPDAIATPTETPVETPIVSPEVTTSGEPTVAPGAQPEAPPSDSTSSPESSSTATPTATATNTTTEEHGVLSATVLENTQASSVNEFDISVQTDGSATLTTDKADYAPTDTVLITGAGFIANKTYTIEITSQDPPAVDFKDQVKADDKGNIIYSYQLDGTMRPNYTVYVKDGERVVATTTFTDPNPSASLSQCANDPAPSPSTDGCSASASDWVNGNVGPSKAVYLEGDSIAYRMLFDDLTLASHTVIIEWDTTKSGKHAIDYLTTFNRTVATANPCLGVSGCSASTTFAIPADPQVTGGGVTPVAGNFTLYGGTITAVSAYSYPDGTGFSGDKSARIAITFSASVANPVLAWGGHIATRADWGVGNSAVNISGSPYHTRLIDLDGSGGNQDRSLSAAAVIFPAILTIIKNAVPDSSQDFAFTTTGLSNFSLDDDSDSTLSNTKVFSVTDFPTTGNGNNEQNGSVAKTVTEGLVGGWSLTGLVCDDNNGSVDLATRTATLSLTEAEVVSCTFTNTLQQAHLTLVKTVTNDNGGGAAVTDWTLSASGPTPISGTSGSGAVTNAAVDSGTYTLSESGGPSGYTAGSWSCVKNQGQSVTGSSITLNPGDNATCTINNNDNAPSLTLTKIVSNTHGGTAVTTNWTLTATGTGGSPTNLSGTTPVVSGSNFKADTYTLAESGGPTGYSASSWSCAGGTQNGNQITLSLGQTASCSITNSDIGPTLKLVKNVTNDNGGTKTSHDWTLTATGTGGFSDTGDSITFHSVNAGVGYVLSESNIAGYQAGSWSCNGGSLQGSTITLGLNQNVTCSISNNDIAPVLHLRKTITNDNGGTSAVTDWTLNATGTGNSPTNLSGSTPVDSGSNFKADTYTLSEVGGPSGYTASSWSCVKNNNDPVTGASITLANGDSATCTINNNDNVPSLHLRKVVNNNNGGAALATAWTLTATGTLDSPTNLGGTTPVDSDSSFKADTYTLAETGGPSGYSASDWVCDGGTQDKNKITVGLGQSATCTITNDDIAPSLTLNKVLIKNNGGTASESNWTLTATGNQDVPVILSGPGAAGSTDVVSDSSFKAGTYALSESVGPAGYSASSWSCIKNNGGPVVGSSITLAVGDNATCTITNDDQPGTLIVRKIINGGSAIYTNFTFRVNGGEPIPFEGDGENELTVDAGIYTVGEPRVEGYTPTYDNCTDVQIPNGGTATCTITNTRDTGSIIVHKYIDADGNIATDDDRTLASDWEFDVNGTSEDTSNPDPQSTNGSGETTFSPLNTGQYNVVETVKPGYELLSASCGQISNDGDTVYGVTVSSEGPVHCTFINFSPVKEITISKSNDKSGGTFAGDTVTYTLLITNTGNVPLFGVNVTDVLPGGFTYVSGSSTLDSVAIPDPGISGGVLSWNIGTLTAKQSKILVYRATIASDLTDGSYKNFATCRAFTQLLEIDLTQGGDGQILGQGIDCNVADSSVPLGHGPSYGGNLNPQVLGAATELPASGSETGILVLALIALGTGIYLKKKGNHAKN